MKAKEYIIQKLVELGKRHRWMKYPLLAVVSLLSFFFLVLEKCLERPRRAVIVLVCLVLIITQGWYLISLAGEETEMNQPGEAVGDTDINVAEVEGSQDAVSPVAAVAEGDGYNYMVDFTCMDENKNVLGTVDTYSNPDFTNNSEYKMPSAHPYDGNLYQFGGWYPTGYSSVTFPPGASLTKADWDYGTIKDNTRFLYMSAIWNRIQYKITYNGATVGTGVQYVPLTNGAGTATLATYEETKPQKTGYHFDGWTIGKNTYKQQEDGSISGELIFGNGGIKADVTAEPYWIPNTYIIDFDGGVTDDSVTGSTPSQKCTYDKLETLNACGFEREGYSFVGWQLQGGDGTVYTQVSNLTAEDGGHVTMVAQWVYNVAGLKNNFTFRYGDDDVKEVAEVKRLVENGDPRFGVTLQEVSGDTIDGISLDKDNYADITGVYVTMANTDKNGWAGFTLLTKDNVRTVGTLILKFEVEDLNNPVDEHGESTTVYPVVTINLLPRPLTVTGVENTSKTYDGDVTIGVGALEFEGKVKDDDVRVYSENQSGTFQTPDAGTGKSITLNLMLEGTKAQYYEASQQVTLSGIGTINRRMVHVTTSPVYKNDKAYILTGEEPEYETAVNTDDLPEPYVEREEAVILRAIRTDAYTCDYKPNYQPGEFSIGIDPSKVNLNNYELLVTPGVLKVEQDTPIELINYEVNGSRQPGNEWYYGENPRVTPTGRMADYDLVYITSDPSTKALTGDNKFSKETTITEEMYSANKTLYIQLAKSGTHAVTAMVAMDVKVDITAPTIDTANMEVVSINTGSISKVANFLSFGNFFQESQMVTIPVTDELSGAKYLTYNLNGSIWDGGVEVPVRNGKASFQIPMNYKGTIALTAIDNAGNSSVLADLVGFEGGNFWVIENQAPEVRISAKDADENIVYSGNDHYYKTVKMTASATDLDSGVAYVMWNVTRNGEVITANAQEYVSDRDQLLTTYDFEREFTGSGNYTVSVTAYDNADNVSLPTTEFQFSVDGSAPDIQVSPADFDAVWGTEKTVTFTVSDTGSGVSQLSLQDANDNPYPYLAVQGRDNTYTFTVTQKGTYTIRAVDYAGNMKELPLEFTRVSSEVPEAPTIITKPVNPQNAEAGWFTSNPEVRIMAPETTPDGTGVTVYYHLWEEGTDEPEANQTVSGDFRLPKEGIWNIRAWSETESGVQSKTETISQIRYDGTAPVISDILVDGTGTASKVSFQVADIAGCLASLEAIYNDDEANAKAIGFTYVGNGVYTASFSATMKGKYSIKAMDAAGNISYADAFEPIRVVVTGISGNVENGIVVTGRAEAGTNKIDTLTVKYGPAEQEAVINADNLLVTTDRNGDKIFTAKFTQLNEDSRYAFLITAVAQNGEHCDYTGVFRTGVRGTVGINVAGTVRDETLADGDTSSIYVVLYDGNDIVQYLRLKNNDAFMFTNLADGAYTMQAIRGNRSISKGLVIQNGTVVEPTDAIRLVIRAGQSTAIEYEGPNTVDVSVGGLENIFSDTTNFGSTKDYEVIDAGGAVEFCMTVKDLGEGEVPASDIALILQKLNRNERVAMYMDLSIWKRSIGAYGIISENQVTSISGGKTIRIVIPLQGELAAKENLSVLRVHGGAVERLADLDSNPNTYTIESTLFSTYALVYTDNSINNGDDNSSSGTDNPGNSGDNSGGGSGNGVTDISKPSNSDGLVSQTSLSTHSSPRTGDTKPIVWIGMLGLVAAIMSIFTLKSKKNR